MGEELGASFRAWKYRIPNSRSFKTHRNYNDSREHLDKEENKVKVRSEVKSGVKVRDRPKSRIKIEDRAKSKK